MAEMTEEEKKEAESMVNSLVERARKASEEFKKLDPVSYTHLTLPTIGG